MDTCFSVKYNHLNYRHSLTLQNRVRSIKENDRNYANFLLILQHNPVFTLGRQGKRAEIIVSDKVLNDEGIDVVSVQRGGKVTYHGPGQLVAYFLLDLVKMKLSVPDFVWKMEETIIQTVAHYGIEAFRREGFPGVWVQYNETFAKLAAVGARASKRITSHGLALNVNTNMLHFQMIVPCGITDFQPISMQEILGKALDMEEVYKIYEDVFKKVFETSLITLERKQFEERIMNDTN